MPYLQAVQHVAPVGDLALNRAMAQGHLNRVGHPQDAVRVSADGVLWHHVNLCCGNPVPDAVQPWSAP